MFYLSAGSLFKGSTKPADVSIVAEQMEACLPYETVTLNGMRSVINPDVIQSGLFIQLYLQSQVSAQTESRQKSVRLCTGFHLLD